MLRCINQFTGAGRCRRGEGAAMAPRTTNQENALTEVPVDEVLSTTDVERERLPSPKELYDRWERQQWAVQDLDLSVDHEQWTQLPPEEQARKMGTFVGFLHGEVMVTETLHAYAEAAPRQDQRLYLTTQIVDEARHVVFFNRMFTDVFDYGRVPGEALLNQTKEWLGPAYTELFDGALMEATARIHREKSLSSLSAGIVIYHLLIENTLALAFQRSQLAAFRQQNFLPGFRAGFTAVTRDESRHVLFGIGFLRDAMREDPKQRDIILAT